jgi:tetratricopeptide (TPR) repeat protein
MLAIQLGLNEEAERLYMSAGRYDLLVNLFMACGRWKDALQTCARHSRIQLKTTLFLYGQHMESKGNFAAAIAAYEKANVHFSEVPRMLWSHNRIAELQEYVQQTAQKAGQTEAHHSRSHQHNQRRDGHGYDEAEGDDGGGRESGSGSGPPGGLGQSLGPAASASDSTGAGAGAEGSASAQLLKWWGLYCASVGQLKEAVSYFSQARCPLQLVEVYCKMNDFDTAQSLCTQSGDLAACYHLARKFEAADKIKPAIAMYAKAKRFNHGIRLAKVRK